MANLPNWAYDMVIALLAYEEEHATEGTCLNDVISKVPTEVRDQAEAIRSYLSSA